MSSPKSLAFVREFSRTIRQATTDPAQERHLRQFLLSVVSDCSCPDLARIATALLEMRKADLRDECSRN
jgi:hypothetical protein